MNKLIRQTRIAYYMEKITVCTHHQKGIYKAAKDLLSLHLFLKIQNIRPGLQTEQMHGVDQGVDASSISTPLERFTRASDIEVKILILNSPDKSCDLDPIPTWLLQFCVGKLIPIITAIINVSMDSSGVPRASKCAQIQPLLKKPTLDQDTLKHYRPVSNLPFIAKGPRL